MQHKTLLVAIAFLAGTLAACSPSVDCATQGLGGPTATPRVSRSTPTPQVGTTPLPTPGARGTPCPTAPPRPSATPYIFPTPRPGSVVQGSWSGYTWSLTTSPGSETLLAAGAGEGHGAVLYRDGGQIFLATLGDWARIPAGPGTMAAVAFGPAPEGGDQVAVVRSDGGRLVVRTASIAGLIAYAQDSAALPWSGTDPAAAYGPEGWLHVAAGGQVMRRNPDSEQWELQATYAGRALALYRAASGALLMHTSLGLVSSAAEWNLVWAGAIDGLAIRGEQVVIAWQAGNAWHIARSVDGGQSWAAPETAAAGDGGTYGAAFPILASDGAIEVTGMYLAPLAVGARSAVPIVARRNGDGTWYPEIGGHVVPLPRQAVDVRAGSSSRFLAVSFEGLSFGCWEGVQPNGASDLYAVTR